MMNKKVVPPKANLGKSTLVSDRVAGNRPSSGRVIINAATVQKIGMTGPNVTSLQDAQARVTGQSVSGVGISALNDPSKGLMNFNIQGTNGKSAVPFSHLVAAKVISNRPGVGVAGSTPGTMPDVAGFNSSNSNLANAGVKINVDSK